MQLFPILILLFLSLACTPSNDPKYYFDKGQYKKALILWKPLANNGDLISQNFLGIQYYFGSIVAIILTIICIMFKFPLPLSFATFFGITNVLEWHWIIALIISSPGLLFLTPKRTKSTFKATFHNAGYFYNFSGKKSDNLKHTIKKHVRNNDIIDGDYKVLKEKQDE